MGINKIASYIMPCIDKYNTFAEDLRRW